MTSDERLGLGRGSSRRRFQAYTTSRPWMRADSTSGRRSHGASADQPAKPRQRSLWNLYRELNRWLARERWRLALALLLLSATTLLKLVPPAATKLAIDGVLVGHELPDWIPPWIPIPSAPLSRLGWIVGAVITVAFASSLLGLGSRWLATRTTKRVQVKIRRRVLEHAARLPLHRVYQLKAGGASSLLRQDADGVGDLVFSMIYNPWRAIVQLIGGVAVLVWVDWRLVLGSLALLPLLAWTNQVWNRRLRTLYRDVRKARQEIDARTTEVFGGMRVVRAFARQRTEAARFVGGNNLLARLEVYAWWWTRAVEVLWDILLPVASGALLYFGGREVLSGNLTLGDLMMFLVYLAMLLEPIAVLANSVTQLQNNLSGFDRVLDLLAEPREMADSPGTVVVSRDRVAGRISLQGVSFTYPGSDSPVLHDINLDIEPGETIALVGRSGAGKTTLCNLIARFYDPTQGTLRLDGRSLREIELESYRRLLGIVEQDVFLFDGTVGENIAYSHRRATRGEIEAAARAAHAAEFIQDLPEGYETLIGERGVRLSGGQRQRLAIARAILADPVLFLLDEATSNLDSESERLIQQSLDTLLENRTSIVIAHRLSTIRRADRIVVLDHGRIVELGSHDQLMTHGSGRYRAMVELQQLGDPG